MSVRVVRDVECWLCEGEGKVTGNSGATETCSECFYGKIPEVVTCAGCRWYDESNNPNDPTYFGWCMNDEMHAMDVLPSWGCASWQARDGA